MTLQPGEAHYFTINEVAKQIGVVPATIRNWEKRGVFTSKRSENGYRIFDFNDIELLKRIKQHSKDENMGMNAISIILGDGLHSSPFTKQQSVSKKILNHKWKEYRLERGFILEDVAEAIGISSSYLSKIENVQANVSFEILQRLSKFYGENLLYYVDNSIEESNYVKKDSSDSFEIGLAGISIKSLVALKNFDLNCLLYTIAPGQGKKAASSHHGQEFVYVLSGKLAFSLDADKTYHLSAGDSLSYNSRTPHSWVNTSKKETKILWLYTSGSE